MPLQKHVNSAENPCWPVGLHLEPFCCELTVATSPPLCRLLSVMSISIPDTLQKCVKFQWGEYLHTAPINSPQQKYQQPKIICFCQNMSTTCAKNGALTCSVTVIHRIVNYYQKYFRFCIFHTKKISCTI